MWGNLGRLLAVPLRHCNELLSLTLLKFRLSEWNPPTAMPFLEETITVNWTTSNRGPVQSCNVVVASETSRCDNAVDPWDETAQFSHRCNSQRRCLS